MRIRIPNDQIKSLVEALARAGEREIGGQLFGEQLALSDFRVTDLTIQARRGSFARFVVDLVQATRDALRFFRKTEHFYSRFNYIGEWHSHPSFAVQPSTCDRQTMRDLVSDPGFKGTFAVLMIVRLDQHAISAGAWLFDPNGIEQSAELEFQYDG